MFETTEPFNMAEFGLITDQPSNSTAITAWSSSLNVRAKDGSVQGVYKFVDSFSIGTSFSNVSAASRVYALTQWTPAGSEFLNIAYILRDDTGKGRVFVHNTNTSTTAEITNSSVSANFTLDDSFPPQLFVFNELLIVNPGTGTPQYIAADATTAGTLQDIPGWLTYGAGSTYPAIARIIKPFGNRLIAMSFVDDKDTATSTDDAFQSIDVAWSSNITGLASLSGAEWAISTTNSAGDFFLTSTPGKILDGYQLGDRFIALKSDAAVRIEEIGQPLVLSQESMFEDDGVYSTRCAAVIGNTEMLIVGNYGVSIINGESQKRPIAKGVFQEALFDAVNPLHKDRSFVFRQTRDKEIWFCFSSSVNTGLGCDAAFVYDYDTNKVHRRSLPNITDIYETEINGQLKVYAASPDTDKILELSTSAYEPDGFFVIEDKVMGNAKRTKEINELLINTEDTIKVALDGTYELSDAKDYSVEVTTSEYKVDTRFNGRYLNLKITMDGGKNPKLTTIALSVRIAGAR